LRKYGNPIPAEIVIWPGEHGFLELEYTGLAPDIRTWKGLVTGTAYEFGGDKRLGYVDRDDGLKFLKPLGDGVAFRLIP